MIIIKKYFRYIGLIGICILSFIYTEKVALYVKNKNPIMQSINEVKDTKYVSSINSQIINDLYIIPGLNGKTVDSDASFSKMHMYDEYNETYLVFSEIKPTISLEDNKDKIIIRGNEEKNSVSIIFEKKSDLTTYMIQNNYKVNLLLTEEQYDLNFELINYSNNETTYNNIEKFLTKNKINKELCYVNEDDNISKYCQDKYLFKPSMIISHSSLSSLKNKISSGEIILIKDTLSITEFNILLNQIKYKDLKIIPLSELITENNY